MNLRKWGTGTDVNCLVIFDLTLSYNTSNKVLPQVQFILSRYPDFDKEIKYLLISKTLFMEHRFY